MPEKDVPVIRFTRKVAKTADSLRITIPKEITEALGIEQGEVMEIYAVDNNTIIVKRMKD